MVMQLQSFDCKMEVAMLFGACDGLLCYGPVREWMGFPMTKQGVDCELELRLEQRFGYSESKQKMELQQLIGCDSELRLVLLQSIKEQG